MNIIITGCTGVGKTTIAKRLEKEINAILIDEPVADNDFLSDSYRLPEKYGTFSQMSFMIAFAKNQDNWPIVQNRNIIQERCISDCLFVFAKNLLLREKIEKREYTLLKCFHDYLIDKTINEVDLYIYLKAPINVISKRIELRNRDFENSIDKNFIETQDYLYEQWFADKTNVIRIDNHDIDLTINKIKEYLYLQLT